MEIFKLFNGTTEAELKTAGFKIAIPWDALNAEIERTAHLRPWEYQKGWIISDVGVEIIVGQKPGRKTATSKADE